MKAPLTREELLAIQERNRGSADMQAVLWEVFRLRALTLRTHDYMKQSPTSATAQMVAEGLLVSLEEEPAVKEQPKL